jgi:hypothetical protein
VSETHVWNVSETRVEMWLLLWNSCRIRILIVNHSDNEVFNDEPNVYLETVTMGSSMMNLTYICSELTNNPKFWSYTSFRVTVTFLHEFLTHFIREFQTHIYMSFRHIFTWVSDTFYMSFGHIFFICFRWIFKWVSKTFLPEFQTCFLSLSLTNHKLSRK